MLSQKTVKFIIFFKGTTKKGPSSAVASNLFVKPNTANATEVAKPVGRSVPAKSAGTKSPEGFPSPCSKVASAGKVAAQKNIVNVIRMVGSAGRIVSAQIAPTELENGHISNSLFHEYI